MKVTTSSLNEELGNVEFILSDKTGTLTKNNMRCFGFSMGGVPFLMDDFSAISQSSSASSASSANAGGRVEVSGDEKQESATTEPGQEEVNLKNFAPSSETLRSIQDIIEKGHQDIALSKLEKEYMTDFLRALFLCNSVRILYLYLYLCLCLFPLNCVTHHSSFVTIINRSSLLFKTEMLCFARNPQMKKPFSWEPSLSAGNCFVEQKTPLSFRKDSLH